MLVLEALNVNKYYGTRKILDIKDLKIYSEDRVGIVGHNGAGKTTLMDILSLRKKPDNGHIVHYGKFSYITQLEEPTDNVTNHKVAGEFGINNISSPNLSGGEKTRIKLAKAFRDDINILFADEPTCNLDINGINILEDKLKSFNGAIVIISHDRSLLDSLCNRIIEIKDGEVKEYKGNYRDYKIQREIEINREFFEYDQYIREKRKLENAILDRKYRSNNMKKTPSRMGNSEARLHKRSTSAKQAKLHQATNALKTRIEKLEKKDKPKSVDKVIIDIPAVDKLHSKIVIRGENITKSFTDKLLFKINELQIYNGDKIALIGDNGCGKTTLIKMILNRNGFDVAPKASIAYFSQDLSILDEDDTILESVMKDSIHSETFVRILLSRLLFKRDDVYKKIGLLSGGERVKTALAKILVKDINLIILDEPTNFLDIDSIEALEDVLLDYNGTLLLVSHDRSFISKLANKIISIENKDLISFDGTYDDFLESKNKSIDNFKEYYKDNLLILENKLSEITSRLSMPSKDDNVEVLDKEFKNTLNKIKELKILLNK